LRPLAWPVRLAIPCRAVADGLPDAAELAALRAWCEGRETREAVDRYLADRRGAGESARGVIGRIRTRLASYARISASR
jgi:hypothetical protein